MIGPEAHDLQRDRVYAAEELALEELYDSGSKEPEWLTPSSLAGFVQRALDTVGWETACQPTIVLDVVDEDERSGWHEASTGVIHLHPRLLKPWIVLHELAHWVDPRGGHGPRFCANFVLLVRGSLGPEAAQALLTALGELDVDVDEEWLT